MMVAEFVLEGSAGYEWILLAIGGVLMLVVIGVFIGSVTLLADFLAFGSHPGFGTQQMIGSAIGAVILAVGLHAVRKPTRKPK